MGLELIAAKPVGTKFVRNEFCPFRRCRRNLLSGRSFLSSTLALTASLVLTQVHPLFEMLQEHNKLVLKKVCCTALEQVLQSISALLLLLLVLLLLIMLPAAMICSRTNVRRVKNAMKLGICSCKASGEKWCEICREKFRGIFELRFLRKEEQQNFTRNFTAFSMATSSRGLRRKFHSSTSASLAETNMRVAT